MNTPTRFDRFNLDDTISEEVATATQELEAVITRLEILERVIDKTGQVHHDDVRFTVQNVIDGLGLQRLRLKRLA